jgi:hypothetical protein
MLQAEELPTSISDLHACLSEVKAKSLTHLYFAREKIEGSHES